jgi:threonylcarbamoyladenosine tRNA methylthiotransferase MtaB
VTSRADHKARALIRALARSHPGALLIVTGCSAQLEAEVLRGLAENVIVVPQAAKARLLDLPAILSAAPAARAALLAAPGAERDGPFSFELRESTFRTRAFLKVQDGCDSCCSYCRVPQARGPSVSLALEEVLRRARELESLGHREIVITGVNISAYDAGGMCLPQLVRSLLGATERARLRLSSIEPESITEDLGAALAHPRVCPHFHLPVQSGADSVLGRMKRRYRCERVKEGIAILRGCTKDPFVASDFIVGFPGETDNEFDATRSLIESAEFAALHVFPFSPRPGTSAAALRPAVPERTRSERALALAALGRRLSASYARSWLGREVEVLLEGGLPSTAQGVTANYLKVRVAGVPPRTDLAGRVARATITDAGRTCAGRFDGFVQ